MALPQQLPGISVVPQAPQVDPRMFALDAQGALMSAQLGMKLGQEMAGLQNLKGKLDLEKAEIAAKKAQHALQEKYALQAEEQLGPMMEAQKQKFLSDIEVSKALIKTTPFKTAADIAAAQAAGAGSEFSLANIKAGIDARQPQFLSALKSAQISNELSATNAAKDYSKLDPREKARQDELAKTAGSLASESLVPAEVRRARYEVMTGMPLAKQRLEVAQANVADMAKKLRVPIENVTKADGTYDFDLVQKMWDEAKVSDPLSVYGDMAGFKEGYTKAKNLRQTQLFLDEVPRLLEAAGDPTTLQKTLDDLRDVKGANAFKAAFAVISGQNVDPATAARSALIDVIDQKLGGALSNSGEAATLKNSLRIQSKDSNPAVLAALKQYRSAIDQAYEASKEGLPSEAFEKVDNGEALKPRSVVAAAKRSGGPATFGEAPKMSSDKSAHPLYGVTGQPGEVRTTPQGTYKLITNQAGKLVWKKQ